MDNLIVVEGGEEYKYSDFKSLIEGILDKNFYSMTEDEKKEVLERKTVANTIFNGIKVQKLEEKTTDLDKDSFVLYDEFCFVLSLCKFNKIVLLEKAGTNAFEKYINNKIEQGYYIINNLVDEIFKNYMSEM